MRIFFVKTIIFILIIIFAQIVIARFIAPKITVIPIGIPGIGKLDKYLYDNYKIIYFGDSVLRTIAPDDTDTSSIVEMLSRLDPTQTIGDLSSSAFHLGIFEAMIDYISRSSSRPEAIIIPINLRSFSPDWDMRPGYQFENEIFFLTKNHLITYFSKPLSVLHLVKTNTVSVDMYLKTPVYNGSNMIGLVKKFDEIGNIKNPKPEDIRDIYIFDYMYGLNENHRKLMSLRNAIDMAKQAGIKIYVYITPIDYQGGLKYVGPDFTRQVGANVSVICSELKKKDLPCLDLSFSLDPSYFGHGDYPNEHLNQRGREFVANQINNFFLKN